MLLPNHQVTGAHPNKLPRKSNESMEGEGNDAIEGMRLVMQNVADSLRVRSEIEHERIAVEASKCPDSERKKYLRQVMACKKRMRKGLDILLICVWQVIYYCWGSFLRRFVNARKDRARNGTESKSIE
ncbi:hypothetical protein IFM89_025447 [Coptis chinensis]|uniref:Uncharacterized protein n=1 Tax=Coptis chinensis TaxID=261450 RepID=A0A835LSF9_9MAGN|nr:hypothetical protein IFM89_025447 [Coptis chinensis]